MLKVVDTIPAPPGSLQYTLECANRASGWTQEALEQLVDADGEIFDALVDALEALSIVRGKVAEKAYMTGELQWTAESARLAEKPRLT